MTGNFKKLANTFLYVSQQPFLRVLENVSLFAANRADGMTCDITENDNSEIFLTVMDSSLYEELKRDVLNMDYWSPRNHYNTVTGLADGRVRKIHLDGRYF